jgi:hypothetical protein
MQRRLPHAQTVQRCHPTVDSANCSAGASSHCTTMGAAIDTSPGTSECAALTPSSVSIAAQQAAQQAQQRDAARGGQAHGRKRRAVSDLYGVQHPMLEQGKPGQALAQSAWMETQHRLKFKARRFVKLLYSSSCIQLRRSSLGTLLLYQLIVHTHVYTLPAAQTCDHRHRSTLQPSEAL